ncbi:hypothetical protein ACNKHP_18770 [Shigella boydii]
MLYQSFPQAERAVPAQAAYLTPWTHCSRWYNAVRARQLRRNTRNLHWQGKQDY